MTFAMMSTAIGRTATYVAIAMIASQAIVLACLAVAYFEPPYLSYTDLPFHVTTPIVVAGNPVTLEATRCNRDAISHSYITTRELVSMTDPQVVIIAPSTSVTVRAGCSKVISNVNLVPVETPSGRYFVRGWAEVNGTFKNTVPWYSEAFNVKGAM